MLRSRASIDHLTHLDDGAVVLLEHDGRLHRLAHLHHFPVNFDDSLHKFMKSISLSRRAGVRHLLLELAAAPHTP